MSFDTLIKGYGCRYSQNVFLFERSPLSNWYGAFPNQSSPITLVVYTSAIDGEYFTFNCAEQALMARKAEFFGDFDSVCKILDEPHPRIQQQLGRQVKGYDDIAWAEIRYSCLLGILKVKFAQNKELRNFLTGIPKWSIIGEGTVDPIYGTGLAIYADDNPFDITKWTGQNLMGRALMELRNG